MCNTFNRVPICSRRFGELNHAIELNHANANSVPFITTETLNAQTLCRRLKLWFLTL